MYGALHRAPACYRWCVAPGVGHACAAAGLAAGLAGCSVVALHGAQSGLDAATEAPGCAVWILPPTGDLVVAGSAGALTLIGGAQGASGGEMTTGVAVTAVFLASMLYGIRAVSRCQDCRDAGPWPARADATDDAREEARAVVARASDRLAACGIGAGAVRIAIAIGPSGRVVRAHVYEPVEPAVARCVTAVVTTLAFPATADGLAFSHEVGR